MINSEDLIINHQVDHDDKPPGMNKHFDIIFETPEMKKHFFSPSSGFEPMLSKRKRLLYVILNPRRTFIPGSETITNMHIVNTLKKRGVECVYLNIDDNVDSYTIYIHALKESVFVIAPTDCINSHRLYEIWVCGAVPILEFNSHISKKYKGLPILWTTNYSEITRSYLESKRDEFSANAKMNVGAYNILKLSTYIVVKKDKDDDSESEDSGSNIEVVK